MTKPISVVAEDLLTQAVLHKCIAEYLPEHSIVRSEVKGGRGNVQRQLRAYAALAARIPVLIGVDLDGDGCAPGLLASWAMSYSPDPRLLIRVAVREVESWVLADRKQIARLIRAQSDDITRDPDALDDPKLFFLTLARATPDMELKSDLVPRNFGIHPRIGPAYNPRMCKFVQEKWRPHVAERRSKSLARTLDAIRALQ